jgi:mono/diheme cytochrome c family protein
MDSLQSGRFVAAAIAGAIGLAVVTSGCSHPTAGGDGADRRADVTLLPTPALAPLPTPEDPALARGYALYLRECALCHGTRGEGQPDWKITRPDGSLPAPPHDSSGHTWHHADAELLEIITQGGVVYMPESQMPGYGDRLSQEEIGLILAWIKTLWGPQERAAQADRTASWQEMYGSTPY